MEECIVIRVSKTLENGAQGLQIFEDNSTDDSEDDDSTDFDPLEDWGELGPLDPSWVAGN